ncbi:MAG: hypothetical protein OEN56_02520 [Gemmatimonadota bacterium]|nr:hypothetical protein [Gemmatimonadota bacterium]
MPFLLRVAMVLGGLFGIVGTTAGLAALFNVFVMDGPVMIGQDPVPRSDFIAITVPFLLLYVTACVTAGSASWSLWKRRRHARVLLTVLLVEFVIGDTAMLVLARRLSDVPTAELGISAMVFVVLVALALWYLFGKRSVVEYYDSLRAPTSEAPATA